MKISALIFAYNRKEHLLSAVRSALDQTLDRSKYEIIVIKNFKDDCIDSYLCENHIKIFMSDGTIGEYIEQGIKEAGGNIICFLDDDDLFVKNKLEIVFKEFIKNNELCYYHNNFDSITNGIDPIKIKNKAPDFNMSCISINLDKINISDIRDVTTSPDTFMYLRALDSGNKIICGKEKLTKYRVHNSTSNSYASNFTDFNFINQKYIKHILENFDMFSKMIKTKKAKHYLDAQITNWNISLYTYNFEKRPYKIMNFIMYNRVSISNTISKLLIYVMIKLHFTRFILYIQKKRYNNQIRI